MSQDDPPPLRSTVPHGVDLDSESLPLTPRPAGYSAEVQLHNEAGRYREFKTIGSGGVGTVSACFDPNLGRIVAMKVLHPELRDDPEQRTRFVREARVMAQIEHPNIVPVHEFGTDGEGTPYFTMKLVEGEELSSVLKRLKKKRPPRRLRKRQPKLRKLLKMISKS